MIDWITRTATRLISFLGDVITQTAKMLVGWAATSLTQGIATGLVGVSSSALGSARAHAKDIGATMSTSSSVNVFNTGTNAVTKKQETPPFMASFV